MKKFNKLKLQQVSIFQKHYTKSVIIPALEDVVNNIGKEGLNTVEEIRQLGYKVLSDLKKEYGAEK